jgi:hypothetical protein
VLDSGAVYLFSRDNTEIWSQRAYLKASNAGAGDQFGRSVSLQPHILAVGANREDGGGTGVHADDDTHALAAFGGGVALDGDTLAVAADLEGGAGRGVNGSQSLGASESGAVYVFR